MTSAAEALTVQFLEWVAAAPRTRADVIEVWQTSCPRLSIFEDALADGLVGYDATRAVVVVTLRGREALGG